MRMAVALAAAVVINVTALAAWEWNANRTAATPTGEVTITQIEEATSVAPLAQATVEGQVVRTASNSL